MSWDFSHRPRLPGAARLDGRVRPRGDLAAGGDLARARHRRPARGRSRRCRSRSRSAACGRRTCRPSSAGRAWARCALGLMHEILGTSPIAPLAFGNAAPDSGNSEILAMAGTAGAEGPLAASAARRRPAQRLQHDRAAHARARIRRSCARARVRDGEDWVIDGRKWFSSNGSIADFLIVMAVTNPEARPSQRASMFIVPTDTPGVEILRDVPTMEHPVGAVRRLRRARRNRLRGRARSGRGAARRRGRGLHPRPAPPRAGSHPPLHALARAWRAGRST